MQFAQFVILLYCKQEVLWLYSHILILTYRLFMCAAVTTEFHLDLYHLIKPNTFHRKLSSWYAVMTHCSHEVIKSTFMQRCGKRVIQPLPSSNWRNYRMFTPSQCRVRCKPAPYQGIPCLTYIVCRNVYRTLLFHPCQTTYKHSLWKAGNEIKMK